MFGIRAVRFRDICQSSNRNKDWESFVSNLWPSELKVPLASLSASSFFWSCLCNCLLCSFVSCWSLSISVCNFSLSFTSCEMLCVISRSPERRRTSAVLLNLSTLPATCLCFSTALRLWRWNLEDSPILAFTIFPLFLRAFAKDLLIGISSEEVEFWSLQFAAKLLFISHSLVLDAPSSVVSLRTSHIIPVHRETNTKISLARLEIKAFFYICFASSYLCPWQDESICWPKETTICDNDFANMIHVQDARECKHYYRSVGVACFLRVQWKLLILT